MNSLTLLLFLSVLICFSESYIPILHFQSQIHVNNGIIDRYRSTSLFETTADFKTGLTFEIDNTPMKLIEFLHVKPGKGSAFVRTKLKNLITGSVLEKTFRAGENIYVAELTKIDAQFSYISGNTVHFLNSETYEAIEIDKKKIPNYLLLTEDLPCQIVYWGDTLIDVILPDSVEHTVELIQGRTATLECGSTIQLPDGHFIEVGDRVLVSTENSKYLSRVQTSFTGPSHKKIK